MSVAGLAKVFILWYHPQSALIKGMFRNKPKIVPLFPMKMSKMSEGGGFSTAGVSFKIFEPVDNSVNKNRPVETTDSPRSRFWSELVIPIIAVLGLGALLVAALMYATMH